MRSEAAVRVKICGVTSPEDALRAVELGAGYVGVNFYPPSPRAVEPAQAAEIAAAVRGRAEVVGVFVHRAPHEVEEIAARVGLDRLQFHGDEPPATIAPFAARALKVFRVRERADRSLLTGFEAVWGYLFDALHPHLFGGSGTGWSFPTLRSLITGKPTFIAGGIRPDNVAATLAAARPWGIDVCSGVESRPGKKDPQLLERLFQEISDVESSAPA